MIQRIAPPQHTTPNTISTLMPPKHCANYGCPRAATETITFTDKAKRSFCTKHADKILQRSHTPHAA